MKNPEQPQLNEVEVSDETTAREQSRYEMYRKIRMQNFVDDIAQNVNPAELIYDSLLFSGEERKTWLDDSELEKILAALEPMINLEAGQVSIDALMEAIEPLNRLHFNAHWNTEAAAHFRESSSEKYMGIMRISRDSSPIVAKFSDQTVLSFGDTVLVLDLDVPAGITRSKVIGSLTMLAEHLGAHPEIKAVVGKSWLMSHPIAKRLGFEVDIAAEEDASVESMGEDARFMAEIARAGTAASKKLNTYSERWGGMSRDMLIKKYGAETLEEK